MTDDTAKAILEDNWSQICDVIPTRNAVEDVRAMARLWLMLPEIRLTLQAAKDLDCPCYQGYPDNVKQDERIERLLKETLEL